MATKYDIHFQGGCYSYTLGVFNSLNDAIEHAKGMYPDDSWEIYNGIEAHQHNWE
jgi:hypothetical protein